MKSFDRVHVATPSKRKLSIWRPLQVQQFVLAEERDVIKASVAPRHQAVLPIAVRIKQRPVHKVVSPYAPKKINWLQTRLFKVLVIGAALGTVYYCSQHVESTGMNTDLRFYASKIRLSTFVNTMSNLGLKFTRFDRM